MNETSPRAPVERIVGLADGRDTSDPVYDQAVRLVRDGGRARLSTLQRHLFIGYNRAANLLETMERNGVLSKPDRNGERKVLPNTVLSRAAEGAEGCEQRAGVGSNT